MFGSFTYQTVFLASVAFQFQLLVCIFGQELNTLQALTSSQSQTLVDIMTTTNCSGIIHERHLFNGTKNENFSRTFPYSKNSQVVSISTILRNGQDVYPISNIQNSSEGSSVTTIEEGSENPVIYDIKYKITNFGVWHSSNCQDSRVNKTGANIYEWNTGKSGFTFRTFQFKFFSILEESVLQYLGNGELLQNNGNNLLVSHNNGEQPFEESIAEASSRRCPIEISCRNPENQWQLKVVIALIVAFLTSLAAMSVAAFYRQKRVQQNIRRDLSKSDMG